LLLKPSPLPQRKLTSPAEVVRIKLRRSERPNSQVLAASQSNSVTLDEDGIFGPGFRWAAAVCVPEAGVDAGGAAGLALLYERGGADGQGRGEEDGEGCELHGCGWVEVCLGEVEASEYVMGWDEMRCCDGELRWERRKAAYIPRRECLMLGLKSVGTNSPEFAEYC
jgi:hypothetical protein